jgi:replicative DNA helicase
VKIPTLSDLRDSGELEQDADVIIFPYRPYFYSKDFTDNGVMELHVAKHRDGMTGMVSLKHNKYINNFFDQNNGFVEPEMQMEKVRINEF